MSGSIVRPASGGNAISRNPHCAIGQNDSRQTLASTTQVSIRSLRARRRSPDLAAADRFPDTLLDVCLENGPANPPMWPISGLPLGGLGSFAVQTSNRIVIGLRMPKTGRRTTDCTDSTDEERKQLSFALHIRDIRVVRGSSAAGARFIAKASLPRDIMAIIPRSVQAARPGPSGRGSPG